MRNQWPRIFLFALFAAVVCAGVIAAPPPDSLRLDDRDAAALRAIHAQIEPLRLALADATVQEVAAQSRKQQLVQAIAAQQADAQRVIADGARALGVDPKAHYAFDYDTMTITLSE